MTIKKYSRNQHLYDDREEQPTNKKKAKDKSQKRFVNALRSNDIDALQRYSEYGFTEDAYMDEWE